ncbi:MAG: ABC transporter substrate-binding protein, partial [Alphaproteobacteria bacterium]|nr:ABC transporter substrate-binding protein [Alphaproteobacteria bacterium]
MNNVTRRRFTIAAAVLPALLLSQAAWSEDMGDVTISHYFTGELGLKALQEQIGKFEADNGYKLKDSPVGHEDFKTDILVRAAGQS